jgi:hypothetical protein
MKLGDTKHGRVKYETDVYGLVSVDKQAMKYERWWRRYPGLKTGTRRDRASGRASAQDLPVVTVHPRHASHSSRERDGQAVLQSQRVCGGRLDPLARMMGEEE